MITNILLGLILGIVLSGYIIINKKVTQIQSNTEYILTKLRGIDGVNSNNNKLINRLLDRFNEFVLRYNELNGLLETKVNHNIEYFDKRLTNIIDKIHEVNENVIVENSITRNDIKKLAKISSRKKQASKQNKSINKQ